MDKFDHVHLYSRHYHISLPYTVILMLIGAILGAFYQYTLIKRFTFIADLTPVQILAIFLPILIFESAFSCDPHIFMKCLGQILILAILGIHFSGDCDSGSRPDMDPFRFLYLSDLDNIGSDVLV